VSEVSVLPIVQALLSLVAVPASVRDQVQSVVMQLEARCQALALRCAALEKDVAWMKRSITLMAKSRKLDLGKPDQI
jgi:hypothetical protein